LKDEEGMRRGREGCGWDEKEKEKDKEEMRRV
jgi:hypothetical protein